MRLIANNVGIYINFAISLTYSAFKSEGLKYICIYFYINLNAVFDFSQKNTLFLTGAGYGVRLPLCGTASTLAT